MVPFQALLAEGRFYSDLELTEKEMERMVIEASRAEYIAHDNKVRQQLGRRESSTSGAEPSSSGTSEFDLTFCPSIDARSVVWWFDLNYEISISNHRAIRK